MKTVLKLIIILLLPSLAHAGVVKTIYFYPKDRTPQTDINSILDTKMKEAQEVFAIVLNAYGYERRSFPLDTDNDGNVSVIHYQGAFDEAHYHEDTFFKVANELYNNGFTSTEDIYFIAIDISPEVFDAEFRGEDVEACGIASGNWSTTPAHGPCFNYDTIAHELAHNFGLEHDIFNGIIGSPCSAAWLDAHPFFNGGNTDTGPTEFHRQPTQLSPTPGKVRISFDVSDPDGVYIVIVFVDEIDTVVGCTVYDEDEIETEGKVYLDTSYIPKTDPAASLILMDKNGNYTSFSFQLDTEHLLQLKVVSVPDQNLAAILREQTNLSPSEHITEQALAGLTTLALTNTSRPINDLTGLEHVINLQTLTVQGLVSISDFSALSTLTDLTSLEISRGNLSDLSFLTALTNLQHLNLSANGITNISTLSGLTNLKTLYLQHNQITDVSPLIALTNLETLHLSNNPITDTSPLTTLQQRNPNLQLFHDAANDNTKTDTEPTTTEPTEDNTNTNTEPTTTEPTEDNTNTNTEPIIIEPDEEDSDTNTEPTFIEGESAVRWVLEHSAIGTRIGSAIAATDADDDTLTYTLSGHTDKFAIDSISGQLTTLQILQHETQSEYNINVEVSDGRDGSASISVTIKVASTGTNIPIPDLIPIYVSFSELMFSTRGGLHSQPQWIELFNHSTTQIANMQGWQLIIEARDRNGQHRHAIITFEELQIPPQKTALIVTWSARQHSNTITENLIYNFFNHHFNEFEQNQHRNMLIGLAGFSLQLRNPGGFLVDAIGNLDGNIRTTDEPIWEMPAGTTPSGARTSLMRRYAKETILPLDGTDLNSWRRTADFPLAVSTHWGIASDIGNPGYRGSNPLPVTLSTFRADLTEKGTVLTWTTESEIDNAGFYILRSETRDGEFKVINPQLIQGAGTTSKRTHYTWTDTTIRSNTRYYYRIEDVSFSGVRQASGSVGLRGFVSAREKNLTSWAAIKQR